MIGIYAITENNNQKLYIGSAKNIIGRWLTHIRELSGQCHTNKILQNSWNKYGEESFEFTVLEECQIDKLLDREQYYIDALKPQFNICQTAGSRLGTKHSEETKRMYSIKRKGMIPWNKGKKIGPLPEEWRKKVADAGRKSILRFNESCKGKHLSEEHRKKVGLALKGRQFSAEHRRKLSEATKRYMLSLQSSGACPI